VSTICALAVLALSAGCGARPLALGGERDPGRAGSDASGGVEVAPSREANEPCRIDADCASLRCHLGLCSPRCGLTGLVAYFPLDGDTRDRSGQGHDAMADGLTVVPGAFDVGYAFDGTRSSMRLTGSGRLTGARTLCAWLKPTSTSGLGQPVFVGGVRVQGDFFSVQSSTPNTPGGSCMAAVREGEPFVDHWGTACFLGGAMVAPNDTWSLVCYAFDGARTQRFFLNGLIEDTQGTNYDYPFSTLTIGSSSIGGTTTQAAFRGVIDEVTIWDRALDPAELRALWNDGRSCVP
jgi:hypothetical protein